MYDNIGGLSSSNDGCLHVNFPISLLQVINFPFVAGLFMITAISITILTAASAITKSSVLSLPTFYRRV